MNEKIANQLEDISNKIEELSTTNLIIEKIFEYIEDRKRHLSDCIHITNSQVNCLCFEAQMEIVEEFEEYIKELIRKEKNND